ncbi:MAG: hypothetical protein H8E98_06835 [Bacteroidetes bacterium]|nr:hypothetical protein [Bacteroidota bacterium]
MLKSIISSLTIWMILLFNGALFASENPFTNVNDSFTETVSIIKTGITITIITIAAIIILKIRKNNSNKII